LDDPKKILFIDGDEKYRRTAESALNHGLYDCRHCGNGEDGLESIAVSMPDVVIVDVQLEDMTGEEFYMRFLMNPRFKANRDVPFIVLTRKGDRNRSHFYNLGFSACLSKPFNANELIEFVEDVLVSHQLKMEEVNCWETIREAKDFLERVVESSAEAIVTTNTVAVVTYCNRAAEEMFGVPFEDIVGKRVGNFMANGSADLLKISALLKRRNKVQNYKIVLLKRTGQRIPVNVSLSIMKNSAGKPMGTLSICKEIGAGQFCRIRQERIRPGDGGRGDGRGRQPRGQQPPGAHSRECPVPAPGRTSSPGGYPQAPACHRQECPPYPGHHPETRQYPASGHQGVPQGDADARHRSLHLTGRPDHRADERGAMNNPVAGGGVTQEIWMINAARDGEFDPSERPEDQSTIIHNNCNQNKQASGRPIKNLLAFIPAVDYFPR
jgi:PAS domain S-box-containing protein